MRSSFRVALIALALLVSTGPAAAQEADSAETSAPPDSQAAPAPSSSSEKGFTLFERNEGDTFKEHDYGVITDKTRLGRELLDNGGGYLDDTANQYPLLLLVRIPFNLPYVGGLTVAWDVPPVYTIMAPFVPFGAMDEKDKAFLYAFGVPRMYLSASRSIGLRG